MDWQSIKDLKKKKCRPIIQVKNLTKQERKKQTGGEGERERGIFIGHLTFNTDFGEKKIFTRFFVWAIWVHLFKIYQSRRTEQPIVIAKSILSNGHKNINSNSQFGLSIHNTTQPQEDPTKRNGNFLFSSVKSSAKPKKETWIHLNHLVRQLKQQYLQIFENLFH